MFVHISVAASGLALDIVCTYLCRCGCTVALYLQLSGLRSISCFYFVHTYVYYIFFLLNYNQPTIGLLMSTAGVECYLKCWCLCSPGRMSDKSMLSTA